MSHASGRAVSGSDFLWLGLALLVLLSLAFLIPVTPNDYWWYVRLGGEIARTHTIPAVETFSYTRAGQPMVYHSWLSALLFNRLYALGGISLTVLARGVVLALTYGLLWGLMRGMGAGPRLASLVTMVAVLAGSVNWAVRPQLFAYPLFALSLWILSRWARGGTHRLWLLPIISLLWVNLHGSFVLLFLLGGAALLFGRGERKPLALALAAALVTSLINPRGLEAWRYVANSLLTTSNQAFSREWLPPVNEGWQMNLFFGWILLFAPLAALSSRKLSRLEWGWFLGFGWLAFSGLRYGIWFLFILAVLSAALLAEWGQRRLDRGVPALDAALGLLFLLMPLLLLPGLRERWCPQAPSALSAQTPVAAAEWLSAHPDLPGPLWSELGFASYLVYALPERPVWIDTRFEVYPPQQWARYKAIDAAAWNWQELLDEEGVNLLVLSRAEEPELIAAALASPGWCLVHRDDVALILSRCNFQEAR